MIHITSEEICCKCCKCMLRNEPDFLESLSALEELYVNRNKGNGNRTNHRCIFLPKFYPELNPIERVWARAKWYIRLRTNGKVE